MGKVKEFLKKKDIVISGKRYGIEAMSAMAQGLFASLIIGTIFGQLSKIPHMGFLTNFTTHIGDAKSPVIGCAIGVAIAYALGAQKLTLFTSAVTGALGYALGGPVGKLTAGIFVILGHMFPLYFGFKGGKGVLVGAVMLAFFDWRVFAIAFALFILSVVLTKWISLGSILGAVSFPITTWLFYRDPVLTAMAFGMAAAVVFMHRSNIGRILHGTENKFSFKSKKTIEASPDGEEK